MSAAKKRRELNRASEEFDKRKLSMQFAISQHEMLNLMESVAAKKIEALTAERDKLKKALELIKYSNHEYVAHIARKALKESS